MQVHPTIAALRSDSTPQRQAQIAMKATYDGWRAEPDTLDMLRELDRFGAGAVLEECPRLEAMFTIAGAAAQFTAMMSRHFCRELAANPLGQTPFRNGFDGNAASMMLARSGRAQLMLQGREPARLDHPGIIFTDALRYDAVIGGRATARIMRITDSDEHGARLGSESIALQPGCLLAFDLASEVLLVDQIEQRLVILRLVRDRENPRPMREYTADSGVMRQQCSGSLATSRQEAIIALLGRMQKSDAAPTFARVALDEGDASLRWQAVRECLAMDTAQGFRALAIIARRQGDPLAATAGALRAQLVETYPQLLQVEAEQCPV